MSRLPTLTTPGRATTSGIPTPAQRRPRSSLANSHTATNAAEMDEALHQVLRTRPPSSLARDDGDVVPAFLGVTMSATPRTPGMRPKTPLGLGQPTTPSARPRSSLARPSLGSSTMTPRRTSMASTSASSTTPYARRPESRASAAHAHEARWVPVVGERVRVGSLGMEGTLRYIGTVDFRDGVWAGVELEGGFAGKGKNDGTVEGRQYFECPANCGVFVVASKLSPPTSGPSRPASVASSYRSMTSALSGRQTPAHERPRPTTTTPGRATRVVSSRLDESVAKRTLLGNSTSTNANANANAPAAIAEGKITAGSRASKYLGMTAKQLAARSALASSTATVTGATTPRAPRVSGVTATATPRGRPSFGGTFTPKARPSQSNAAEMMPPPPSPTRITARLEAELADLQRRHAELEEARGSDEHATHARMEELRAECEKAKEEADALRYQLTAAKRDAADASRLAEELQAAQGGWREEKERLEKEAQEVKREMKLQAERAQGELEANIEDRRREVGELVKRAESAEARAETAAAEAHELKVSGESLVELLERKEGEHNVKLFDLREENYKLRDRVAELETRPAAPATPPSPSRSSSPASPRAQTAAEIDNETLTAQVKHLQNKIAHLEDDLDDARAQAEQEVEGWAKKYARAKDDVRAGVEEAARLRADIARLNEHAAGARTRMDELQGALRENQAALEAARAEIEALRIDANEASTMRSALAAAADTERTLAQTQDELAALRSKVAQLDAAEARAAELEVKVGALEREIGTLQAAAHDLEAEPRRRPGPRTSTGSIEDAERSIVGYRHIIQDKTAENASLVAKVRELEDEVVSLKEEIKLLQEISQLPEADAPSAKELSDAKARLATQASTIAALEREVSELESLVEAKIYREDELETRASKLQRELARWKAQAAAVSPAAGPHSAATPAAAATAAADTGTKSAAANGDARCAMCEGPHELDVCPVFAGGADGEGDGDDDEGDDRPSPLAGKVRRTWCADCETSEHNTADCPLASDVF
ncbi:hypothetical protein Q5752_004442 [Cryptotrichosporon argae]